MPITDYNKKKPLEVSSTNDSGTTQDKAQAIIVEGFSTKLDDFESGSSQLGWENQSNFTIDTNSEINGTNTLQIASTDEVVSQAQTLSNTIDYDTTIKTSIKLDNQPGTSNRSRFTLNNSSSNEVAGVEFIHDGDIEDGQGNTIRSWSANTVYDVEIKLDFSNNQYDVIINGTTEASQVSFSNNSSDFNEIELTNNTNISGATVNTFHDDQTYDKLTDSTTGTGDIGVDFTNIADEQDIAVYDENGNLLDYEIESLDTTAETGVLWCYNSWTRDDSVQAQVVYGDNSANEDRSVAGIGSNPWDNGQNAERVYHLNSNANDSTGNSDGTITGATDTSGQFDGALSFDGTDDNVENTFNIDSFSELTITCSFNTSRTPDGASNGDGLVTWGEDGSFGVVTVKIGNGTDSDPGDVEFTVGDGGTLVTAEGPNVDDGNNHSVIATLEENNQLAIYTDGIENDTNSYGTKNNPSSNFAIAENVRTNEYYQGVVSDVKVYSEDKSNIAGWRQAEHDASPKAGQVYFSQQAAQATVTDQTVTVPETTTSSSNPDPQINATVDLSIPTSTATTENPAPNVSPGAAPLNLTATTANTVNPDFTVQPGSTTVQTPVSTSTISNPDPQVNAFNEITVPETTAATVNPAPTLTVGQTIITPETTVTSSNPDLTVQPGETSLNISTTQVSASNPEFGLNRQIVVGVATNLRSENPEPNLQAGAVSVQVPETSILTENPALQLQPGATILQIERPTNLETVNPDFNTVSGAAELQVSETQLTASVQEPSIGLTLQFVSPTNALITNDERFFDMPDHTFTEGDLGDTLQAVLKTDASPDGVDLTGATEIKLVVKDRDGVKVFDKEMSLADKVNGKVEYKWNQGDFIEEPGVYRAKIKVFDSTGEPESFPNDGFRTIEVEEEIG